MFRKRSIDECMIEIDIQLEGNEWFTAKFKMHVNYDLKVSKIDSTNIKYIEYLFLSILLLNL